MAIEPDLLIGEQNPPGDPRVCRWRSIADSHSRAFEENVPGPPSLVDCGGVSIVAGDDVGLSEVE
ncbi:MAG: hypothetical protein AAGF97_15700 [Planctomycetota bacterium]